MLAKSGEHSGKVLGLLRQFLSISEESISEETGFSKSAVMNFFTLDVLPRDVARRLMVAMRLTQSDYSWLSTVLTEIKNDRDVRVYKLKQIQNKLFVQERKIEHEIKQKELEEQKRRQESLEAGYIKQRPSKKRKVVRKIYNESKGGDSKESVLQQIRESREQVASGGSKKSGQVVLEKQKRKILRKIKH